MAMFGYRLLGAALLDDAMYEGIEADSSASWQAGATVTLSGVAAGIGASGWRGPDPYGVVVVAVLAVITWVAWATLMFHIGGRLMRTAETETSLGELMRTIGFATAPGFLQVFGALPHMTWPVFAIAWLWILAATVKAVRHALDFQSTSRTLAVCLVAAALSLGLAFLLGLFFGPTVS